MTPAYLELELPLVTEWLPENDRLCGEANDRWIEREQRMRWKPGEDRNSPQPVDRLFTLED